MCLRVTLLDETAKPYSKFTVECLSQVQTVCLLLFLYHIALTESWFGTIHNSPKLLHIIKKKNTKVSLNEVIYIFMQKHMSVFAKDCKQITINPLL